MHSKLARSLLLLCIVRLGCGAPAPSAEKRRESTPEILDLEQELKKQAGEDKKFYPNQHSMPIPQIDGLDDNPPVELQQLNDAAAAMAKGQNPELNPVMQLEKIDEGDIAELSKGQDDADEKLAGNEEDLPKEIENEAEEDADELLEEEDDRKAFMDGLMDSLQRNPELLNQLMRDNQLGTGFDEDIEDNGLLDNQDVEDAIRAEVMSAMRGAGTDDARPLPMDVLPEDTGVVNGMSAQDLLEAELQEEAGERERHEGEDEEVENEEEEEEEEEDAEEEEDPYRNEIGNGGGEDEEEEEEEKSYYEDLLEEIANTRPELLRENSQVYLGDKDAHVVAKKRGYAAPAGYGQMAEYPDPENDVNILDPRLSLAAESNIADELSALRGYWERMQEQEEEEEEEELEDEQPEQEEEEGEEEEEEEEAEEEAAEAEEQKPADRNEIDPIQKRMYHM